MDDDLFILPTVEIDPKLKRAQSLVGTSKGRDFETDKDYYPSPPEAFEALLRVESFEGNIWEPACGNGVVSEVFKSHGFDVISTDLVDRGYGIGGHDFLTSPLVADNIVTNPPFTLAEKFVELSLQRTKRKVVMLCKLAFLEGAKRKLMFENTPFKACYVFSKRLSMTRNGEKMKNSGMIPFALYVWEHGYTGAPTIGWI